MSENQVETHELHLQDQDGGGYTGRITGRLIGGDDAFESTVYLTERGKVIVYDGKHLAYIDVTDDPEKRLLEWLGPANYVQACAALGISAVVDLDL